MAGDALKFTEHQKNWQFADRDTSLATIVDAFDQAEAEGRRLDAILVTNSGKPMEVLLGIVTIHDMPKVLRGLDPRRRRAA